MGEQDEIPFTDEWTTAAPERAEAVLLVLVRKIGELMQLREEAECFPALCEDIDKQMRVYRGAVNWLRVAREQAAKEPR